MNSDLDVMERLEAQHKMVETAKLHLLEEQILISLVQGKATSVARMAHSDMRELVATACNLADLLKEYQEI